MKNKFDIRLACIPDHSGIPENDAATVGRILVAPRQMTLDIEDVYNNVKTKLYTQFKNTWKRSMYNKDQHSRVQSEFTEKKNGFPSFPIKTGHIALPSLECGQSILTDWRKSV